jgi:hypothetical protein
MPPKGVQIHLYYLKQFYHASSFYGIRQDQSIPSRTHIDETSQTHSQLIDIFRSSECKEVRSNNDIPAVLAKAGFESRNVISRSGLLG